MASDKNFQTANKIIVSLDSDNSEIESQKREGNSDRRREMNGSADQLCVPRTGHRLSFMEVESFKEKSRLNLLKQISAILKQREQKYNKEALHKAFQDEDLLERIFRLFDVERQDFLVQEDWIEFLKERLTEEKQQDFVEQIESVAYVVCGENVITVESFQLILKNKVVTNKLLRVVDTGGDGSVTADDIMEFISAISSCRPRVGIDKPSVDRLEQLFQQTVGNQKEITREQFQKIVVSKNPFFTERVFQIFDEDNSGTISHQEFIAAVHRFGRQTPEDKIRFLFKVYDLDGDGLIQHRELQHVMRACMEENGMQFSDEQLMDLTGAMFEDADNEGRGAITYEALRDQLNKHEGLLENLSITIDRWLVPPQPKPKPKSFLQRLAQMKPYQLSIPYFKNNYVFVSYLFVFFVINFGLFVARIVEYWDSNVFVIFARACGQCLNFNCTWALVLMLRRCITSLRTRGLGEVLPLDHHVYLHKITGVMIVVYSVIHTIMHLCNFSLVVVSDPVLNARNWSTWEWVCTSRPGLFGLCGGCANPSGLVLLAALVALAAASRPKLRAGGYFEVFYFTHLLYIPFYVILIIHAPNFWKWFIGPGTIYIIERIVRLNWMRSEKGKTYIASGILLPSRVTHLVIKRPPLFDFHAGDYVFVNIPAIAVYEWHPFTISSAPEQEDYLWLHIRGVGEWTNRLYSYFEEQQKRLHGSDDEHAKLVKTISSQSNRSKRNGSIASAKKRSVEFSPESFTNAAFTMEEEKPIDASPISAKPARSAFLSPLRILEKSRSVPDMRNNKRRNESKLTLGECHRWESERELVGARRGRRVVRAGQGALAQSFRYMRTKPTVLDFAPPLPEVRRRSNESILSIAKRRLSKGLTPEKDVESIVVAADPVTEESTSDQHPDYPVGRPLEIYLDGPYGAASSRMFRAQHAALIAAGIGVTPFASVLQAIMFRYRSARATCPQCQHSWTKELPHHNMSLRKVDFFWINREQRSFEWFVSLLSQLEMEQAEGGGERFLELHMFVTSALQRADMRAVGLQLALDLLHQKEKRDLITGLKTRTNAGRPNWDKVFQRLQEQRKGKVTVFYCGPPQLARVLRVKCDQFGFNFCKEAKQHLSASAIQQLVSYKILVSQWSPCQFGVWTIIVYCGTSATATASHASPGEDVNDHRGLVVVAPSPASRSPCHVSSYPILAVGVGLT